MRTAILALLGGTLLAPQVVLAQASVTVLGLTAPDGDDEIAENLTSMLRRSAEQSPRVSHSGKEVMLTQMVLAFGCDEPPDADCLRQIGQQTESDGLVYGYVRRARPAGDRLEIQLFLFDVQEGREVNRVEDTIPPIFDDIDDLRVPAQRMLGGLFGDAQVGTLRVVANVSGAALRVDGRPVGELGEAGYVTQLPAGPHRIEVTLEGHRTHVETVEVAPGRTSEVQAALEPADGTFSLSLGEEGSEGGPRIDILGWGLVGGGGVLVLVGLYFTVKTAVRNGDSGDFYRMRAEHPGSSDVCAESGLSASEQDLCDTAAMQSTLQYVFYGLGAIAGGIGLYLLLGDSESEDGTVATSLRVDPAVLPGGGALVFRGLLP